MASTSDVASEKGNAPYPEALPSKLQQSSCIAAKCVAPPQQRYAAARSVVPSKKNVKEAAIQLVSPVLGSAAVAAVTALGLDGVGTVVLVTVVLVVMFVLGDVAAGFSAGFAVGPVVGCPAAGLASAGDLSTLSPGTSRPSVSPAGGVATSGSTTTCGATAPAAVDVH